MVIFIVATATCKRSLHLGHFSLRHLLNYLQNCYWRFTIFVLFFFLFFFVYSVSNSSISFKSETEALSAGVCGLSNLIKVSGRNKTSIFSKSEIQAIILHVCAALKNSELVHYPRRFLLDMINRAVAIWVSG